MKAKDEIIRLFNKVSELSVKEIVSKTSFSKQMVHLVLNKLVEDKILEKLGKTPKTIYRLIKINLEPVTDEIDFSKSQSDFLNKAMIVVTETGNLLAGKEAFIHWCKQRKLPVEKTLSEFILTKQKYEPYYEASGIINGTAKLKGTKGYDKIWIDDLFYLDFYAIERFGKTKLGTLLHYAKQGQNKFLMNLMMLEITERIKIFLKAINADAIGFVPPTIRREVQIMKFIQNKLNIALPVLEIKKISGIIPVPQKSLSKLDERIKNAENTFAITEQRVFKHLVLIDDAVGSGSTLNQIAGKIKNKGVATKITGLAIVGSFKGFDVITDV
jgi:phosphoribosylpyrophosphate synthetase